MTGLKTLLIYTLIIVRFCCSAQNKEYFELVAANPIINEAFERVDIDTKGLPNNKMIYFLNILKKDKDYEIWICMAGKDILQYMLAGREYTISGYGTFNNVQTLVITENYSEFFKRTGRKQTVCIKDSYPALSPNDDSKILMPIFETFRWVFSYKDKKLELIKIDYEYPFEK